MNQKKVNKKKEKISSKAVKNAKKSAIQTDPFGSYTGRPKDSNEVPTQDADDL